MRVRDREQRRHEQRMRHAFRLLQDHRQDLDRAIVMVFLQLDAPEEIATLVAVFRPVRLERAEQMIGRGKLLLIDEKRSRA